MILDPIAFWLQQIGFLSRREAQEVHEVDPVHRAPAKMAAKQVLLAGRTVNFVIGSDHRWHLRRRLKQLRKLSRESGSPLFQWRAMPSESRDVYGPLRFRKPWWWI